MHELDASLSYLNHLRIEHRNIQRASSRVFALLESQSSDPSTPLQLADSLRELAEQLAQHFRKEEQGGCIEEAVSRCPNLAGQAEGLRDQQQILLDELEDIISQLGGPEEDRAGQRFLDFAKRLTQHESLENRLLARAFGLAHDCDDEVPYTRAGRPQ